MAGQGYWGHSTPHRGSRPTRGFQHEDQFHHEPHPMPQQQIANQQMVRSAQASKQMAFDVYANVISILEEFEKRELAGSAKTSQSRIDIPDQSHKSNEDIRETVDGQLLLFQINLRGCAKEIAQEVRKQLQLETLKWMAHRQERNIYPGHTDQYAAKLFEILTVGKTEHPNTPSEKPNIDEKDLKDAFTAYMAGDHKRGELDKKFKDNPSAEAELPEIRQCSSINKGIQRLLMVRQDLREHIPQGLEYVDVR